MKISIIGAGAMGGAMAEGFAKCGVFSATDISVSAPHEATLSRFKQLGLNTSTSNVEAATGADIVVLAVKPWLVEQVVSELKPSLDYEKQTIVSVAAGVSAAKLQDMLRREDGTLPQIFLAIPNIAIAVLCSATFIVNVNATKEREETLADIFNKTGSALVTEERLLTAGTALASCGIAYAMRYIRAAMEGGVELGFKSGVAQRIVEQTVKGAVELLQQSGAHPEAQIDKVCTPGGMTIRGLNEMEHAGFSSAVVRGLKKSISS